MKISKELKTGIIGVAAIALTIWGYNYLKKQNLFNTSDLYYSEFNNIQGLTPASIVTINGFQVGNVKSIQFNPEKQGNLIVGYSMNQDFQFSKNSTTKIIPGLMGGAELQIIPSYVGENATSGMYLTGNSEQSMISSLGAKLEPLEGKLNSVLLDVDKLVNNFNNILDDKTQQNLKSAISELNQTLANFKNVSKSMDVILANNTTKFDEILNNANSSMQNLNTLTGDFEKANLSGDIKKTITKLNGTFEKLDTSLANVDILLGNFNSISQDMKNGKGSIGKLLNDDGLYVNLENTVKEMEELLRELKEHPKRFVHFSLFGKKDKTGYVEKENTIKP